MMVMGGLLPAGNTTTQIPVGAFSWNTAQILVGTFPRSTTQIPVSLMPASDRVGRQAPVFIFFRRPLKASQIRIVANPVCSEHAGVPDVDGHTTPAP